MHPVTGLSSSDIVRYKSFDKGRHASMKVRSIKQEAIHKNKIKSPARDPSGPQQGSSHLGQSLGRGFERKIGPDMWGWGCICLLAGARREVLLELAAH